MARLLPFLLILLVGCGRFFGGPAGEPPPEQARVELRIDVDLPVDRMRPFVEMAPLSEAFPHITFTYPVGGSAPVDLVVGMGEPFEARAPGFAPLPASLLSSVPAELRHEGGRYAALDRRAWVLAVGRLMANAPTGLLDAAEPRFKGRLARPAIADGLDTLFATVLADRGAPVTQRLLEGVATNQPEPIAHNPTDALAALRGKQVDLAITNHMATRAQALTSTEQRTASAIEQAVSEAPFVTVFPDADASGVPWSAALIALAADSPHPKEAEAVLRWLLSPAGQTAWSAASGAYPAHPDASPAPGLRSPDTFRWSQTSLTEQAELRAEVRTFLGSAQID